MRILYFTNTDVTDVTRVPSILQKYGDEVLYWNRRLDYDVLRKRKIDFVVSDRPRSLIRDDVLANYEKRIINLHPSFLPWGKGYYPNYFSIKNREPFGVTIHYIDAGIDTGDIICQTRLFLTQDDTLRTTYDRCREALVSLLDQNWKDIRSGKVIPMKQDESGSLRYKKDFEGVFETLSQGWDTPIKNL